MVLEVEKIRRLEFKEENKKTGKVENIGYIEIKNQEETEDEKLKLYFYGDIGSSQWQTEWYEEDKCPDDITKFFDSIDKNKDIDVYFNSGGGDVFAGIAMYNIIKRHQGKTTAHVDGLAASTASVILCACDDVIVYNGSQVMVHKPSMWAGGNSDDFYKAIERLDKAQESIVDVYMTKVKDGVERSTIEELVNNETWLTTGDIQNYFDFSIDIATNAMTACNSTYFDKYKNKPNIKINDNDISQVLDIKTLQNIVDEAIKKVFENNKASDPLAQEKEKILNDLDSYGI